MTQRVFKEFCNSTISTIQGFLDFGKSNNIDPALLDQVECALLTQDIQSINLLAKDIVRAFLFKYFDLRQDSTKFMQVSVGVGGLDARELQQHMILGYSKIPGVSRTQQDDVLSIKCHFTFAQILASELGVHKIIRHSPFTNKRQTSFVSVNVFEKHPAQTIDEKHVKFYVCRSSGGGGQHVNKTDSAVKAVFVPLNISVRIEDSRSQIENKASALKLLKAKVEEHYRVQREKILSDKFQASSKANWGNKFIRTIFLHPQKFIKDARFGTKFCKLDRIDNLDFSAVIMQNNIEFLFITLSNKQKKY